MKIGFQNTTFSPSGAHSQHLAKLLAKYAPQHEYIVDNKRYGDVDIYHGFKPRLPLQVWIRRVPSVVTVHSVDFLRHPENYPLAERLFVFWSYRRALRAASCLIAMNRPARETLSEKLGVEKERIEVVMPLVAPVQAKFPNEASCEVVRRKYDLPEKFILMLGTVEPRHNHKAVFKALLAAGLDADVVVCGRRTAWANYLLQYARERHIALRVDFIYELSPEDLPALLHLARAFVYLPDGGIEASVVPVIEAMRAGLPMVLSDTPLHREAAADAAVYIHPESIEELAAALENVLLDEDFREQLIARERQRAELFSEYAVAQRLIDIYSTL